MSAMNLKIITAFDRILAAATRDGETSIARLVAIVTIGAPVSLALLCLALALGCAS